MKLRQEYRGKVSSSLARAEGEGARPHMDMVAAEIAANNFANNLMTWNYTRHSLRQLAFDDMEVGAAYTACQYFQQDMTGFRFGCRNVFDLER